MRWKARHMRKALWHRWFAWHPVTVGGKSVWLECVQYKQVQKNGSWCHGGWYYTEWKAGW